MGKTAIPMIASLGERRDIPFNKLVLSASNVRKQKKDLSIDDLAEDIARRGLLKNLNVRPVIDGQGKETGMFEVPAGGRRYRALEMLVKTKRLARTAPVPCAVRPADSPISAEEDSLAENVQVLALHPVDQFRAFRDMVDGGASEAEIAARFFVTPNIVRQRLRLAAVAPELLDAYADDQMTLEHLMAFTVNADHRRQLAVWEAVSRDPWRSAHVIRRQLTEGALSVRDRRVRFISLAAYEEAGGTVLRDLFSGDEGGWLDDVGLVEMLVARQLGEAAEHLAQEGWKWVEAAPDFPYGHTNGLRALAGIGPRLSDEEQSVRNALVDDLDALYAEHEAADEIPAAVAARLADLEAAIEAYDNRPIPYEADDIARAGAFVSIDGNGRLRIERGFVRPEDEAPIASGEDPDAAPGDGDTSGATPDQRPVVENTDAEATEEDDHVLKPLSERLLGELSAYRTLALRDAVALHPNVALTLLLHSLVNGAFRHDTGGSCLDAAVRHIFFPVQGSDLKDSASAASVTARHARWEERIPSDDQAVWEWLIDLDDADRLALLAHCVSYGVTALIEKVDRYGGAGVTQHMLDRRIGQADRLARAVGLDMVEAGWRPTVETYLGKVTKPRILAAVEEARGEETAGLIDHLKKADMAREAERLLEGSGWLPEVLRTPLIEEDAERSAGNAKLPAYLEPADRIAEEPGSGGDDTAIAIAAE